MELLGKDKVEGSDAWKLKVTLKNGDVRYVFLDADQYLEIRTEGKTTIRGTEIEGESTIGDYKEEPMASWCCSPSTRGKGRPQRQKMTIEKWR